MTSTFPRIAFLNFFALFSLCLAGIPRAAAQTTQPKFEYLMTFKALLEPTSRIDDSLLILNVLPGGWVKGPEIAGSIVPPGGDWIRVMPSGVYRLDVRLSIKTDGGDLLFMTYNGIVQHTENSLEKQKGGEKYTQEDMAYFVIAPTIQTSSKKYEYLNRVQLIGKFVEARRSKDDSYVMYDLFIVR